MSKARVEPLPLFRSALLVCPACGRSLGPDALAHGCELDYLSPWCRRVYAYVCEQGALGATVFEALAFFRMENKKDVVAPRFSDLATKHGLLAKTDRRRPPRPGARASAHVYVDRRVTG